MMTFSSERFEKNQQIIAQKNHENAMRISRFKFEPEKVMTYLKERIIGQDEALIEIENMLKVVKADFNPPDKPLSVTLMLGPTGIGKTETVRIIAEAINGNIDSFCRIDMNTLAQEHYAAALIGAPPGYVGSKEGHTLFDIEALQGNFSKPGIVLFDEIEKANDEVIRALLNVLETGILKLTAGTKSIDFRNSMIFMTSNIGAKESQKRSKLLNKLPKISKSLFSKLQLDEHSLTQRALDEKFDPEFLNRIDRILYYKHLNSEYLSNLIHIELNKLNSRLQKQGRHVCLSDETIIMLTKDYAIQYGARGINRQFRTKIEPLLANEFIMFPESNNVRINYENGIYQIKHLIEEII